MSDHYSMPLNRTYCKRFRCCRELDHKGDCELDITYLTDEELKAIRDSARTEGTQRYIDSGEYEGEYDNKETT